MKKSNVVILKSRHIWIPSFRFAFFNLLFFWIPQSIYWRGCCWRGRLSHPMLSFFYCYFFLKSQNEIHEEVKSWWNGQRGLYWQHSNSYIMVQPTDLFCHTVLIFVKVLAHLLANIEGKCKPHNFPVEQEHTVTPWSIGEPFSKKSFSWQMGKQNYLGKLIGGCCSTWWINDQIMPRKSKSHKFTFQ